MISSGFSSYCPVFGHAHSGPVGQSGVVGQKLRVVHPLLVGQLDLLWQLDPDRQVDLLGQVDLLWQLIPDRQLALLGQLDLL
jgi:hypothetical protein